MRIAFISQPRDFIVASGAQRGSVAIVTWELAKRLAERHEVVVYAPLASGQKEIERPQRTLTIRRIVRARRRLHRTIELGAGLLEWSPPYFVRNAFFREYIEGVAERLASQAPDVIHVQVSSQFVPVLRAAAPRARIVLHVHDELLTHVPKAWVSPNLAHVDAIATCSDYIARRWREHFPEYARRVAPIGNGVDLERFCPNGRPAANPEVLFVGRVSPEKGAHVLAKAFNRVVEEVPGASLSLAGPAGLLPFGHIALLLKDPHVATLCEFYGRNLIDRIALQVVGARTGYLAAVMSRLSPQARRQTRVLGSLGQESLPELYRRAAVLAAPSVLEEPFGMPLVEALACGLPVVASRAGGMAEIVEHGVTGAQVERNDADGLAEAIVGILRLQSSDAAEMRRAARAAARERFGWPRTVAVLEALYAPVRLVSPFQPVAQMPRSARRAS